MHAQKLLRLADSVVFCFDGDAAGRKAAWRAMENMLPVLADGKEARFLFLPDAEDPDDFVRKRGKAAFEQAADAAMPLSAYLLTELTARHPPGTAEGRAALVAAARPFLSQITAPVLAALLKRQLAELAGLPEAELGTLVQLTGSSNPQGSSGQSFGPSAAPMRGRARASARGPARRAPSLLRSLLQGVLLEPSIVRRHDLPSDDGVGPEASAWRAVLEFCKTAPHDLTTAGLIQHFAGSDHAAVLADLLASSADQELNAEQAEAQVLGAAERMRRAASRRVLQALLRQPLDQLTAEERESLTRGLKAGATGEGSQG